MHATLEPVADHARYTHDEAVAIGMTATGRTSCAIGATGLKMVENQERIVKMAGLPTLIDSPIDPSEIVVRLNRNKKRVAVRVRWVLHKTTGEVFLIDQIPPNVALDALFTMIASWDEEH